MPGEALEPLERAVGRLVQLARGEHDRVRLVAPAVLASPTSSAARLVPRAGADRAPVARSALDAVLARDLVEVAWISACGEQSRDQSRRWAKENE